MPDDLDGIDRHGAVSRDLRVLGVELGGRKGPNGEGRHERGGP
jgi:hypothetical protein